MVRSTAAYYRRIQQQFQCTMLTGLLALATLSWPVILCRVGLASHCCAAEATACCGATRIFFLAAGLKVNPDSFYLRLYCNYLLIYLLDNRDLRMKIRVCNIRLVRCMAGCLLLTRYLAVSQGPQQQRCNEDGQTQLAVL